MFCNTETIVYCFESQWKPQQFEQNVRTTRRSGVALLYVNLRMCLPSYIFQFLICSLAFATFSVDKSKPENRLQLSFTLVLTAVAFKSVVNSSLPRISYLTYMVSIPPQKKGKFSVFGWLFVHFINWFVWGSKKAADCVEAMPTDKSGLHTQFPFK